MDTYTLLRGFADSWGMVSLFLFFAGVILWVLRPGSKKAYDDAANVIFRNESKPKDNENGQ